jgi:hypothetical protein
VSGARTQDPLINQPDEEFATRDGEKP